MIQLLSGVAAFNKDTTGATSKSPADQWSVGLLLVCLAIGALRVILRMTFTVLPLGVSSLRLRVFAATLKDVAAFLFMAAAAYKHLYNTKAWHRLRWHQLQNEPLCVMCTGQGNTTAATIVDHIEAHRGDEIKFFDPSNLQSLCKRCHDSVKQQLEKSGVLRGCDTSGWPLDPNHHWNKQVRGVGRKSVE